MIGARAPSNMPDRFAFARKENCFATFAVAGHAAIRLVPNLKSSTRGCSRDANIGGFVHGASPQSSSRQAQNHMPSSFQSRDAGRHAIQANCWRGRFAACHGPTHWSTRTLAAKPGISDTRCPKCAVPTDSGGTWSRLSKGRAMGGRWRSAKTSSARTCRHRSMCWCCLATTRVSCGRCIVPSPGCR